jgi:hypothetical protein
MENNKNIWLLPTNEPSRLSDCHNNKLHLDDVRYLRNYQNIYITSDENIKDCDWVINIFTNKISFIYNIIAYNADNKNKIIWKKIILTTDPTLIADGIQPIPDEFLEWFIKNPSCEFVEVKCYSKFNDGDFTDYKIIIPKEEPKQETLEEAMSKDGYHESDYDKIWREGVEFGVKWQSERMYSEEEMYSALQKLRLVFKSGVQKWQEDFEFDLDKWFEQFKKK